MVWTISVSPMPDFQNISDFSMRLKQKPNTLKKNIETPTDNPVGTQSL